MNKLQRCIRPVLIPLTLGMSFHTASAVEGEQTNDIGNTLHTEMARQYIEKNFTHRFQDDAQDLDAPRTIYFPPRSDAIAPSVSTLLSRHLIYFNGHDHLVMIVVGYADERGSPSFNLELGLRRAKAVQALAISLGVNPARTRVLSFGEDHPAVGGAGEEAQGKNRRVEILYLDTHSPAP